MGKREDNLIKLRLSAHLKLMTLYVSQGVKRENASKEAYKNIKGLKEKELRSILYDVERA